MSNSILGQILGSVFSNAMRGRSSGGPFGGASSGMGGSTGGGLGDLLGGMIGRSGGGGLGGGLGGGVPSAGASRGGFGNKGMLVAMLLPLAMQWVQRNGGIGAVVDRFKQKGFRQQADSWVSTGPNQMLDTDAVGAVVGSDELSRLSRQLGVPEEEVATGFAEILPEMVDQLSPQGQVPADADDALNGGISELEQELSRLTTSTLP